MHQANNEQPLVEQRASLPLRLLLAIMTVGIIVAFWYPNANQNSQSSANSGAAKVGEKGAVGLPGARGATGSTGQTGLVGPQGPVGVATTSGGGLVLSGNDLSFEVCNAGEILKTNGVTYGCATDDDTTYSAGDGVTIAPGAQITALLGSSVDGSEIVDGSVLSVDISNTSILFEDMASNGCTANQVFQWSGASWSCGNLVADIDAQDLTYNAATRQLSLTNDASAVTLPLATTTTAGLALCDGVGANTLCQNGNSFGAPATIGTNDAQGIAFETGGVTQATISTSGAALFKNSSNSAVAFQVQDAGSLPLMTVDSSTGTVSIGTSDGNATLLVLDSKTSAGDPAGVNGAQYYNQASGKFRCYENGVWKDCIPTGPTRVKMTADVANANAVANTLIDATGLAVPVVAGTQYEINCSIRYTSAATTTGSRWVLNGPTATVTYQSDSTLSVTTRALNTATAYNFPAASSASSLTVGNIATIQAFVTPTVSGTVQVRFASEIANSAITARVGSYCDYQAL